MLEGLDRTRFQGKTVGIATGGASSEREISLATGRAFEEALLSKGYDLRVYDIATDLSAISAEPPAVMLLGTHGGLGERGALQGFLECMGIPYTGSGVLASALAMDKARAKILCELRGVPVAKGISFDKAELEDQRRVIRDIEEVLSYPLVAKLNNSGSSYGVYICADVKELEEALIKLAPDLDDGASSKVLVERFLDGPEYSVGFFGSQSLGVMEIRPGKDFYDFEAKYESDETVYEIIDDERIVEPLTRWGRAALEALGCRGVARVDFKGLVDQGAAMLEVNTIPGMTATSIIPKLARAKGMDFPDFVEAMLVTAGLDEG